MTATEPIDLGLPATTERLILRPARLNDTDVLTARRNQPLATRFQSWRVLDLVVDEARRRRATEFTASWMPGPGSPEPFYRGYGFRPAGEPDEDGEIPGLLSI